MNTQQKIDRVKQNLLDELNCGNKKKYTMKEFEKHMHDLIKDELDEYITLYTLPESNKKKDHTILFLDTVIKVIFGNLCIKYDDVGLDGIYFHIPLEVSEFAGDCIEKKFIVCYDL